MNKRKGNSSFFDLPPRTKKTKSAIIVNRKRKAPPVALLSVFKKTKLSPPSPKSRKRPIDNDLSIINPAKKHKIINLLKRKSNSLIAHSAKKRKSSGIKYLCCLHDNNQSTCSIYECDGCHFKETYDNYNYIA